MGQRLNHGKESKVLGKLGINESYQLAMYLLDQYRGTVLTCRYELPPRLASAESRPQLEEAVKLAVVDTIMRHPMMQVGMKDATSKSPSWIQLQSLDLTQHEKWVYTEEHDDFEQTVQDIFCAKIDERFPDLSIKQPGWWLTVIRQGDAPMMEVLLSWNNPQFDGTGAKVFHEDVIEMLNAENRTNERTGLDGNILRLPQAPPLLPMPIERSKGSSSRPQIPCQGILGGYSAPFSPSGRIPSSLVPDPLLSVQNPGPGLLHGPGISTCDPRPLPEEQDHHHRPDPWIGAHRLLIAPQQHWRPCLSELHHHGPPAESAPSSGRRPVGSVRQNGRELRNSCVPQIRHQDGGAYPLQVEGRRQQGGGPVRRPPTRALGRIGKKSAGHRAEAGSGAPERSGRGVQVRHGLAEDDERPGEEEAAVFVASHQYRRSGRRQHTSSAGHDHETVANRW